MGNIERSILINRVLLNTHLDFKALEKHVSLEVVDSFINDILLLHCNERKEEIRTCAITVIQ